MFKKKKVVMVLVVPSEASLAVVKGDKVGLGQELWLENRVKRVKVEFMADLPLKQVEAWVAENKGKSFEKGELVYRGGFLKKDKRRCTVTGEVCGVDEFGKIEFLVDKQKISFGSPVAGKIIMAGKGKIELEFEAVEYGGEVNWDGWIWSQGAVVEVLEFDRLTELVEDKIVLTPEVDDGFLVKSEVLGATAIVTAKNLSLSEEGELPVFVVSNLSFDEIVKNKAKVVQVGIDGDNNKLYLVE